ncbi:MAG: prolipoprotein diacylglyceryl transferase [Gammaproteobacteria bacterium]|jgi:phosphatidylglycerol---prolipoprotein diacylglyceryl transferase|nr:prolipoprotein diacylglyceryl transferase [Gammaproteobacteria bacterium]
MLNYPDIDPVAIDLGILQIRWYGISYICGILLAWWFLRYRALNNPGLGWTAVQVSDLIYYGTLGVIIGGRLGSVVFYNLPYYVANPLDVLKVWQGGMSFHGGLLGVMTAVWIYSRKIQQSFFDTTDFLIPVVPIGLFFGRIANFINAELWGAPTNLPWGVIFPNAGGVARHPSQLYEALLEGLVLFAIMWFYSSKQRPRMAVTGLFLSGYGVFRSSIEFVREPDRNIGYIAGDWLTMGQVLSIPMIIAGVIMLFLGYRKNNKTAL